MTGNIQDLKQGGCMDGGSSQSSYDQGKLGS